MPARKLLLVEDDATLSEVYQQVLREAAFDLDTAANGNDALLFIQQNPYDLVLLDIMMPKKDGIEVLEALKFKPAKNPKVRIVLLTNLAHDPVIKKATELGASGYIIKTDIFPGDLVNKVNEYLALN
ncbi:TPA: response regulator [candidate division WWE3 bacterium]|uniref:Response regulator receiver modulated metal dependent phosphohydrolase n=4 Tax=Katanobacteria TaxID=422282 RepID=A0A0G1KMM3_UNCKA|nr:MAG: Response regulator receiver modulated metal dependent phosphohydrolase [candidate division WWE3 bacterium GW2011_GWA2_44_16]KKT84946.1 MAG: Response regulator receiver modulated metal dependent phosphohydrolase [candidate division WWE3 bacterium GW2011_GWC2_44_9]OGC51420.1 MAG: hypothetical protein A2709_03050 [candidate division WWE3 bacterium RIFCSPHIGHO2_01_FULL_43_9]HAZ29740.1 response regulator [candidate division WWE3 bacterium]